MGEDRACWRVLALTVALAGCAHKHPVATPEEPAPAHVAPRPQPPSGAAADLPVPEPGIDGSFHTINSGVSGQEAAWHVRSALNVAALYCRGDAAITRDYNALLISRKAMLATAYAAETTRFRGQGQGGLDSHMTKLYNFFAQPPAQMGFCAAAAKVAAEAGAVAPAAFPAFAEKALDRLEAPTLAFYRDYDRYRSALAAWQAGPHPTQLAIIAPVAQAVKQAEPAKTERTASSWRIQLGAFTGKRAAETAWERLRTKLPALAVYKPLYEKVPGRPELVRLQIGSADDRAGALKLCATAAAGGLDCLPVAH